MHQDSRFPRHIYGIGLFAPTTGSERGQVWESSMPAAYKDTQFGDGIFAGVKGVQNIAIGTNRPQDLQYNSVYYNWVRFNQYGAGEYPSSTSGEIQVAVQLGSKLADCTATAWCTLKSLATIRVLPWICNYRAPNSLYVPLNNHWKSWYFDGYGSKNERCAETGPA